MIRSVLYAPYEPDDARRAAAVPGRTEGPVRLRHPPAHGLNATGTVQRQSRGDLSGAGEAGNAGAAVQQRRARGPPQAALRANRSWAGRAEGLVGAACGSRSGDPSPGGARPALCDDRRNARAGSGAALHARVPRPGALAPRGTGGVPGGAWAGHEPGAAGVDRTRCPPAADKTAMAARIAGQGGGVTMKTARVALGLGLAWVAGAAAAGVVATPPH